MTPGTAGVVAMRPVTADCATCHVDAHGKKYTRCTDCHDVRGFSPSTIDVATHAHYRFPLTGAHRAVLCAQCHTEMRHAPVASTLVALARWAGPPLRFAAPAGGCAGCHQSVHGTQFAARPDRGACESCHDMDAFRPARRFDHNRDAGFSLKGAHANVLCDRCHSAPGPTENPSLFTALFQRPVRPATNESDSLAAWNDDSARGRVRRRADHHHHHEKPAWAPAAALRDVSRT
jgi:hypothetical protein